MKKNIPNNYLLFISIAMLIIDFIFIFILNTFSRIVYVIFFYHVSSAWLAYLTYTISLICHIIFFRSNNIKWSRLGKNSIIIGVFFTAVALITGSLWFNATSGAYNNIYWNWGDARQTTTLILFFSFLSYLIFYSMIEDKDKKAKISAILGIAMFAMVPISYLSAIFLNTLHPLITPLPGESGHIYWDPFKLFTLFYTLIAVSIFFVFVLRELVKLDEEKEKLDELIQRRMEDE